MSGPKILIVDDEEDHRFIIGECLKDSGFTNLVFATSGEEGIKKAAEDKPAIVLTDTNLGRMNGFDVCRRIKKDFPQVKVIIMTGDARYVDFPKAQSAGADEYKVKTGDCGEIIWGLRRLAAGLEPDPAA